MKLCSSKNKKALTQSERLNDQEILSLVFAVLF